MKARLASANPHKLVELRRALPEWEIELTDDHEAWLTWMVENNVQHVRLG